MKNGAGYNGSHFIHNAIQKYGVNSFEYITLKTVYNQDDADFWENYFISEYESSKPEVGYNLLTGRGALGRHSDITKAKLSEINMGHEVSEDTRNKISQSLTGNVPWNKGKTDVYSEETREQISASLMGHVNSPETREKISVANAGENHPFYGKKHSDESIKKMSEAKKGITGENAYRAKLAKKYDVSKITISNIVKFITYKSS